MIILIRIGGWRVTVAPRVVGLGIPLPLGAAWLWCYGPSGINGGYYWRDV